MTGGYDYVGDTDRFDLSDLSVTDYDPADAAFPPADIAERQMELAIEEFGRDLVADAEVRATGETPSVRSVLDTMHAVHNATGELPYVILTTAETRSELCSHPLVQSDMSGGDPPRIEGTPVTAAAWIPDDTAVLLAEGAVIRDDTTLAGASIARPGRIGVVEWGSGE
jgi:hypothetical protein